MNYILILHNMALSIDTYININNKTNLHPEFDAKKIPYISVLDYLRRIYKYGISDFSTLILTYHLITIYLNMVGIDQCTKVNIHRLIVAAFIISAKYNEDILYRQSQYSIILGITLRELNYLEKRFLIIIDFNIPVLQDSDYDDIVTSLS